jgi:hypothetical protein
MLEFIELYEAIIIDQKTIRMQRRRALRSKRFCITPQSLKNVLKTCVRRVC